MILLKKVNKRLRNERIAALVILLVVLAVVLSFCSLKSDMSGGGKDREVTVNITQNMTADNVVEFLKDNDVIRYPSVFKLYLRAKGMDSSLKAGIHNVNTSMSYKDIVGILTSEPLLQSVAVTIPEGYEFDMIAEAFADKGLIDYDLFCDLAESYDFGYDFLNDIPKRECRLEGYLFPDTYFVSENDDEIAILNMMLERFSQHITEEFKARADELGMTVDQVVTLASIIQREAANSGEMGNVSSVFHNRLKSDEYPYLQSCATVQYILDERKPVLSNEDTEIDSPYNTYINKGLPLGPIASAGADALTAALYPADTDYYFFVAGEDGNSIFSENFDEHVDAAY